MRYRVVHLLLATVAIGVFAAALANPNWWWASLIRTGTWLLFGTLAIRVAALPARERGAPAGALILGLSNLALTSYSNWLPISQWLRRNFVEGRLDLAQEITFQAIGQCLFALLFALVGALLGAHFSRSQHYVD